MVFIFECAPSGKKTGLLYVSRDHAGQESRKADRAEDAARFNVAAAAEAGRSGRQVCRSAWQVLGRMPVGRQEQALPLHGHRVCRLP